MKLFVMSLYLFGVCLARPTDQEDEYSYNYNENEDYQRDGQDDDYDRNYDSTDQDGDVHEDAPLINDKPDFVSSGKTINVDVGESATLSCQVNDLGGNQMIWLKRPGLKGKEDTLYLGELEVVKSSRRSLAQIENNQGTILTISQATKEDAGTYICKIADPNYDQKLDFHVTVGASNPPSQVYDVDRKPNGGAMATTVSVSLLIVAVTLLLVQVNQWT